MANGMTEETYSAGERLRIRDAEWFVRKVEAVKSGGQALYVRGITSPVQGRDQIFWTSAERGGIEVIRPEDTEFKLDTSAHGVETRLRIESTLRSNPVASEAIAIAHHAAMDVMNYQLQPAEHALNSPRDPRARILIADAVGLGKTLEAGILLSELIVRGAAKRILVVTLKSMMAQFQKEMWCRFSIPLMRLDSAGLQRIRQDIPSHHNPFNYYDKTIISIDTLKQDNQFQSALEDARWDVVVIDEAHNVSAKKSGYSQRYRLAAKLADRCDHMILLSATPHDGSRESFASLMSFLDPLAIPNPSSYSVADIKNLFERRFKKHVADEIAMNFPERRLVSIESENSFPEAVLCKALNEAEFEMDGRKRGAETMFRMTLMKALLSSPAAFISTAKNRKAKLEKERPGSPDIALLADLIEKAEEIKGEDFTKYSKLVKDLKHDSGWDRKNPRDRVVIFTESIPTAKWLVSHLVDSIGGLKPENVKLIHGSMRDVEVMQAVEEFQLEQSKIRVLIASDVASEGINLHECAHRMYHFDIPWSLITFQQRNGRIDRYGQTEQPIITFMLSSVDEKQGDLNVLKHVIAREKAAHDNIGDPGQLMQVYSVDEETKIVSRAIAAVSAGADAETALESEIAAAAKDGIENDLAKAEDDEGDFWSFLEASKTGFSDKELAAEKNMASVGKIDLPTLFTSETEYLSCGLKYMQDMTGEDFGSLAPHDRFPGIWKLSIREGLKEYCRHVLPYELRKVLRESSELQLTADAKEMQAAVKRARSIAHIETDEEGNVQEVWPDISYLWQLNPVSTWITDNVNATFGSREAPVVVAATDRKLPPTFLLLGQVPNKHGEPLVQQWMTVSFPDGMENPVVKSGSLSDLTAEYGIDRKTFANARTKGDTLDEKQLQMLNACRVPAVKEGRKLLEDVLSDFMAKESPVNDKRLADLEVRLDGFMQLEFSFLDNLTEGLKKARMSQVDRFKAQKTEAYNNFKLWVETHREPSAYRHCQIVAVLLSK